MTLCGALKSVSGRLPLSCNPTCWPCRTARHLTARHAATCTVD
jgi:hypothetical protein